MNFKKIIDCEVAYSKCFCSVFEDDKRIRFRDHLITDMYDHNYTLIKSSDMDISSTIMEEIDQCIAEGKDFCEIRLYEAKELNFLDKLTMKPSVSHYAFYATENPNELLLKKNDKCETLKIANQSMIEQRINLELAAYSEEYGSDFCRRKGERIGLVYLSSENLNSYLCYVNKEVVGKCDLFIHDDVAKLEDFDVIINHQRQGYGTAIIKKLVDDAVKSKANFIYLMADEDETAKEMYIKLGFKKFGDLIQLFFKFSD